VKGKTMEILIALIILFALIMLYFLLKKSFSRSQNSYRKQDSAPTKVNLIIGNTPPPGGITFKPDGTIERVPDTPTARYKWTVQKMTYKIEQEPEDGEWYFERGKALMGLNQYQEAIPDFSKVIDKFPTFGGYYEFRGLCYFHTGDKINALADLRRYKNLSSPERLNENTIKVLDELEKELS
jgi:tetratricopeptide (TPR) repeat protein